MSEESRENYRNFKEMMDVIHGLRTTGLTRGEIAKIAAPSKYVAADGNSAVSDRTVKRILNSIISWYGHSKCYQDLKTKKWHLIATDIPDYLDISELQALNIAIKKLDQNQDLVGPLTELNAKLTSRFDKGIENRTAGNKYAYAEAVATAEYKRNAIFAFMGPRAHIVSDPIVRNMIEEAIAKNKVLTFTYHSKKGANERTVHPVGIMVGPSNVYMVAFMVYENGVGDEPTKFTLENISNVRFTGDRFKKYSNFSIEEYANRFFGIFSSRELYDVEWRAAPNVADAVKRFTFHPTQTMIDNPDGSVTIRFHAGGLRAMATYLFQWAGDVVPIAPAELVEEYRLLLTKCLETIS